MAKHKINRKEGFSRWLYILLIEFCIFGIVMNAIEGDSDLALVSIIMLVGTLLFGFVVVPIIKWIIKGFWDKED